jgi:CBS domain containing-hemolysin-like protein
MTPDDWRLLGTLAILLGLSAFFSACEIGLLSAGKYRLRQLAEDGSWTGRLVVGLRERPAVMLTAILITITGLNYISEAIATSWLVQENRLGPHWGPIVAIASLTVIVLIFSEATPITYAAANPARVARVAAAPVWLLTRALWVPVRVITVLAGALVRLTGGVTRPRAAEVVTEQELRTIVEMEAERGGIEPEEKEMIHSIFEFGDKVAREIMVPRPDMVLVERSAAMHQAAQLAIQHRLSRLPVYDGDPDHIVGVIHAKSLLPYLHARQTEVPVARAMRPPAFIPETKRVSELLEEFRKQKQTLAIVVDEYGGTAGLVTIEDLLEEIVGEIYDEYDVEYAPAQRLDAATWVANGKLAIDDANELEGVELPTGDYDTVAGLICDRLGAIPEPGARVETDAMILTVDEVIGRRVTKVRMTRKQGPMRGEASAPGEEQP